MVFINEINKEQTVENPANLMAKETPEANKNLMLKDTTTEIAPNNLSQLLKNFTIESMTIADICFQLIYLVALETGFAELDVYAQCARELWSSHVMASYFIPENVSYLTTFKPKVGCSGHGNYSMHLCSVADDDLREALGLSKEMLTAFMTAIVSGDFLIVTLTPLKSKEQHQISCARSLCLSMPRYVVGVITKQNQKPINECLLNMDELTRRLRDELFVPLRSLHCTLLELDIYPALLGLPLEIYHVIFKFLNGHQLQTLSKVHNQFAELIGKEALALYRSTSSIPTPDLPPALSSYFEVEPYF